MPTYEYTCKSCGEHLEVVQSFKDDPLTTCSNCGGQLRKVFGNIGISFKGSGFYKNDSRAKSSVGASKSESGGGEGAAKTDSTTTSDSGSKSESTSSAKSDGKSGSSPSGSGSGSATPSAAAS